MSRTTHTSPTFQLLETETEINALAREIQKIKPKVEVTVEGRSELAKGRIIEWHAARKFFVVEWDKKSDAFSDHTNSRADLRAFFKGQLFSTQLMFKSIAVRRLNDDVYHFRIPEQMYKQQRRGALRVPIIARNATLITPQGDFEIVDLSVGGAKFKPNGTAKIRLGSTLLHCELKIGRKKISPEHFGVKVTSESETTFGCRFAGLETADQVLIKQFLMEALRQYYKEEL